MITQLSVANSTSIMNIQYHPWNSFYEKIHIHIQKYIKAWRLVWGLPFDLAKTSVWLGNYEANPISDYRKLSGDVFADQIIISF